MEVRSGGSQTPRLFRGGTVLQPLDDVVWSRFTGRDLLRHRNVRIGIFSVERSAIGFEEQPDGKKGGSLVAVRQL